jgi:ribosomal protein L37AE/L43A
MASVVLLGGTGMTEQVVQQHQRRSGSFETVTKNTETVVIYSGCSSKIATGAYLPIEGAKQSFRKDCSRYGKKRPARLLRAQESFRFLAE